MYNVIFKNISGITSVQGAITWTQFKNKQDFDRFYDEKARGQYQVVEEDVTIVRAMALSLTEEQKDRLVDRLV